MNNIMINSKLILSINCWMTSWSTNMTCTATPKRFLIPLDVPNDVSQMTCYLFRRIVVFFLGFLKVL